MNKFDRIQILKVLGLNTEESILISSVEDWCNSEEFLNRYEEYSVRTFRGPRYGQSAPHFPIVSREELEADYKSLLEKGLKLIVAAPIDPKDAEMAGCLIYNAGVVSAEVALGPGTVRRVTSEGRVDLRAKSEEEEATGDPHLDAAMSEVRGAVRIIESRLPDGNLDGLLFEFSWYSMPVGWKSERLIFWELASSPRQEQRIAHMRGN